MRVTDLEKFSLEQIWRPYQNLFDKGQFEKRLTKPPFDLSETANLLAEESEWSRAVWFRLKRLHVTFPHYIDHPLADLVRWKTKP